MNVEDSTAENVYLRCNGASTLCRCMPVCKANQTQATWLRRKSTASTQKMAFSRKIYTNEDLLVAAAAIIIVESETKAV
jgi:hypothetical protein